ncbi:MAG: hypothetical protein J7K72_02710 [Candidatus Aenigmarchaeota archaeon]|nr:hypothetical protein [Candidatus Aenigmarchaeota archaeon]
MREKYFLLKIGKRSEVTDTEIIKDPEILKPISSSLGWKIFCLLTSPNCPIDIARTLGVHEQKVYYYVNKFRKKGLLRVVKEETRHGTIARFYKVKSSVFSLNLGAAEWQRVHTIKSGVPERLEPFIKNGEVNFTIVVGSPDPHGPWKGRALDAPTAIDLALFLGSFVTSNVHQNYKLDVEVRERDMAGNLILVGGPVVNMVTKKVNKFLPIRFDMKKMDIISEITNNRYVDEECGLICLTDNPWNKKRKILIFAGKRFSGTRAAILAFIENTESIVKGNKFDGSKIAKVVRGYDINGDGIIDKAEILE